MLPLLASSLWKILLLKELCALMHKKKINLVDVRKDHEVEAGNNRRSYARANVFGK
jgi:rhodanese-related sulfurtransferase